MKFVVLALLVLFVTFSSAEDDMLKDLDNEILFDILKQEKFDGKKNDANFCASKSNGDYPDPKDCSKYITCSNGMAITDRNCPSGLYFNPKKNACDYPSNVDCKSGGKNFCSGKKDGDYPDANNCYGFITCSNGMPYPMKCPSGTKFNNNTKQCDHPENVDCSAKDEVQYDTDKREQVPSKDPFCKDKPNGNYVNPYECEGFIMCSNHLTYFFDCPSILQYNAKTDRCDWPRNVKCGPTPKPTTEAPPTRPTPSSSTFCKNRRNGNYVDKNNCNGFIMCSNHLTYFFDCPANLRYNAKTDRCDWPWNVKCGPTPKPTTRAPPTRPTPSSSTFCKDRRNGNYVDKNNCNGFIMCSNHLTYFFDCPADLRYNAKTDQCDWPWNVKCGPTPKPTGVPPTRPTPSSSTFCKDRRNGNYVDKNNCNGFIMCSNHLTYFFDCPADLRYNAKTDQCDWPWNVKCGPTPKPTTRAPPTRPTPSSSTFCKDRRNGNYVDKNNCNGFIMCSNHLTYFFDCPANLRYNAKTDRCDWPWNVKCGPTPKPTTGAPPTRPTPSSSTFCKDRRNGNYVDKNNCNGFIMCSNHLTYFFDCPADLRYNAKTDRCDWPENVKCPPKIMGDAQKIVKSWKKNPFCMKHRNGDYRDVTDCEGYFTCYYGYQNFRDCPGTQRFNPKTRRCDLPRHVKCAGAGGGTRGSGFCKRRKNGDYRDVLNCNGFIKCSNSYTYYFDCPSILRFNVRTDECDWPENVPCPY